MNGAELLLGSWAGASVRSVLPLCSSWRSLVLVGCVGTCEYWARVSTGGPTLDYALGDGLIGSNEDHPQCRC